MIKDLKGQGLPLRTWHENTAHIKWDMKHTISEVTSKPNCARSHFPHNFWSSHEYFIHCEKEYSLSYWVTIYIFLILLALKWLTNFEHTKSNFFVSYVYKVLDLWDVVIFAYHYRQNGYYIFSKKICLIYDLIRFTGYVLRGGLNFI